jgi:hypothetical protein
METGISNFFFKKCKVLMTDGVDRFYVESRAGIQFTPKRKLDILHIDNGLCSCHKVGSMKHIISCCSHRSSLMTNRHNNVGMILVQAIGANNRKKLVKSTSGQFIHWNQELRLPDDVNNRKRFPNIFDRKESKRKPDIWYYTKEKKGERTQFVLNLIEITIPWNDAVINENKIQRTGENKYVLEPFKKEDRSSNTLADVQEKD